MAVWANVNFKNEHLQSLVEEKVPAISHPISYRFLLIFWVASPRFRRGILVLAYKGRRAAPKVFLSKIYAKFDIWCIAENSKKR